jgi:metal-sulfur cluster biosynthetic enzyme
VSDTVAGVWAALGTVLDPEIDEPITDLDFVESCTVTAS